jgi:GMP synthase-like glutamine amidotransferase
MRIGILKTDTVRPELVDEFGEYPDMFRELLSSVDSDLEFIVYDVEHGEYPEDLDEVDAYLMTGSKSSVYEDQDWIHRLSDFVRELHDHRKKLVGICFGHQMVAHALGGKTEKSAKGWGVGAHEALFHQLPEWHDGEDPEFILLVSHQDQVVETAPGTEVLASSEFCEHAVCQVGEHILTLQGHPEFIKDYSKSLLTLRRETFGEDNYSRGMESLARDLDRERVAGWIVKFLRGSAA